MKNKPPPTCPICGHPAKKIHTVYGPRYECHGLWSWGSTPLADKSTHELRRLVHSKFDPLWKTGKISRTNAYRWLARKLGISYRKCHMKLMGKKTLKKVLEILKEKKNAGN